MTSCESGLGTGANKLSNSPSPPSAAEAQAIRAQNAP